MSVTNNDEDLSASLSKLNIDDSIKEPRRSTRERNLTAKAQENAIQELAKQKAKLLKKINRKKKAIEDLMNSNINSTTVKEELHLLSDMFRALEDISLADLRLDEDDEDWFEEQEEELCVFKHKVYNWLKTVDQDIENRSQASRKSRNSSRSSRSNKSARSIEDKKKLRELEASSTFLDKKAEVRTIAEKLEMQEQLARLRARVKVDDEEEHKLKDNDHLDKEMQEPIETWNMTDDQVNNLFKLKTNSNLTHPGHGLVINERSRKPLINFDNETDIFGIEKDNGFNKNIEAKAGVKTGARLRTAKENEFMNSNNELCEILKLQSVPEIKMEVFKGDPTNYDFFMAMFHEVVEKRVTDQVGRLTRLLKYTEGEPKDLIKYCIHQSKDECYNNAKELLKRQYGNPNRILAAYRDEIENLPSIRPNESSSLRKLYIFLMKVDGFLLGSTHNPLDNCDTICRILSKLPVYMQDRWSRNVHSIRMNNLREPKLKDLISLIDVEMTMSDDPMYSRTAVNKYKDKGDRSERQLRKNIKSFASEIDERKGDSKVECHVCKSSFHSIESCQEYLRLSREERSKKIFKCRLCFKCLRPISSDHTASNCNKPLKCIVCCNEHPTTLHGFQRSKDNLNASSTKESKDYVNKNGKEKSIDKPLLNAMTRSQSETISLCIVPIEITHDESSSIISTHAMLDSCSQGSFISDELAKKLSLKGRATSLSIKTVNGEKEHQTTAISNLKVRKNDGDNQWLNISRCYTQAEISIDENDVASYDQIKRWDHLSDVLKEIELCNDIHVDVLIGANCPKAIEPLKFVHSKKGGPYAVKTRLGWCIVGPTNHKIEDMKERVSANRTSYKELQQHGKVTTVEECDTTKMLLNMYNQEFVENSANNDLLENLSIEEKRFMKIVESGTVMTEGKYEVPLPFKESNFTMPNNRRQAFKRFENLENKFNKKEDFKRLYFKSMTEMLTKGYAEGAKENEHGKDWYIPHHGVTHPEKPSKIRIVFDASAEYENHCINKMLLKGPDLTNQLVGVLIRFREERIVITADIEGMFFQVKIPPHQRSYFKFLWYRKNDPRKGIQDHQMTSHIFGGTSSPSCSNFALRKTAKDHQERYSSLVIKTLLRNFYVDDLLKSLPPEVNAISFVEDIKELCLKGGFKLTKFTSNKPQVLMNLPIDLQKNGDIENNMLNEIPEQSTLGMKWNANDDTLRFKLNKDFKPLTRRGMLSTISSIYDPLGLVGPYILEGRKILQHLCKLNISWDERIPDDIIKEWQKWRESLNVIENVKLQRCLRPLKFDDTNHISLHIFSDASDSGYGVASYLRFTNKLNQVQCSLLYGRSRVNPTKYVSIPRMELAAALLAAKTKQFLLKELDLQIDDVHFWTDSQVVLGYLKNQARSFKTYVANRVQQIQELSNVNDWHYVESKQNPADHASRGFKGNQERKIHQWFNGPSFLSNINVTYAENKFQVDTDDSELKVTKSVIATTCKESIITSIAKRTTDWLKITRIVAYVLKFISNTRTLNRQIEKLTNPGKLISLNVEEIKVAKETILKVLHNEVFRSEVEHLQKDHVIPKSSNLYSLKPILVNGVLRVGGRLSNSNLIYSQKHPIILPKTNGISNSIIQYYHRKCAHGGRYATINQLRQNGFWLINCTSQVKRIVSKCVTCKRLFARCEQPLMGDLPQDRTMEGPPFTYVGVDLFGPIYIKERRSTLKRYGVLFTCLNLRSVHIEIANSLSSDSFILSLRRFIGRRGNVKVIRSDNGTNFVGAAKELDDAFKEMDEHKIKRFLLNNEIDWICWKRNPPYASHMGGVWERQIRTIRRVLSAIMTNHKEILNDESLRTMMIEVEATVNSRPLTVENINDPDICPLTPSSILTMKSDIIQALPGEFPSPDKYSRKQWRRVQFLADQFWSRWKKEYLLTLQERKIWNTERRNMQVGDIVLIKEESERNNWPMGRVIEVFKDKNGTVRSVKLKVHRNENKGKSECLSRPVTKVVLLIENTPDSPTEEPTVQNEAF